MFSIILYWCETLFLTLEEQNNFRVPRRIFGLKRGRKWQEAGEDYIMRSFITYTLH
jgi:hypothetical protein